MEQRMSILLLDASIGLEPCLRLLLVFGNTTVGYLIFGLRFLYITWEESCQYLGSLT